MEIHTNWIQAFSQIVKMNRPLPDPLIAAKTATVIPNKSLQTGQI